MRRRHRRCIGRCLEFVVRVPLRAASNRSELNVIARSVVTHRSSLWARVAIPGQWLRGWRSPRRFAPRDDRLQGRRAHFLPRSVKRRDNP
jgi:hypothetical protein